MSSTYYLGAASSDLNGAELFNRQLVTATETAGSITLNATRTAWVLGSAYTNANVPYNNDWETGTITVKVNVTTANANINMRVIAHRVNSAGAIQESTTYSAEQTLSTTGVKTFTIASKDWAAGNYGDRLRIDYEIYTGKNGQSCVIATGTSDTSVATSIVRNLKAEFSAQTKREVTVYQGTVVYRKVGVGAWSERGRVLTSASPNDEFTDVDTFTADETYSYYVVKLGGAIQLLSNAVSIVYQSSSLQAEFSGQGFRIVMKQATQSAQARRIVTKIAGFAGQTVREVLYEIAATFSAQARRIVTKGASFSAQARRIVSSIAIYEAQALRIVYKPVEITISEVSTTHISAIAGLNVCEVTFASNQALVEWEAREDGTGNGVGALVGYGTTLAANTEATFEVWYNELTQGDKTYRINIYGKNADGEWTEYAT